MRKTILVVFLLGSISSYACNPKVQNCSGLKAELSFNTCAVIAEKDGKLIKTSNIKLNNPTPVFDESGVNLESLVQTLFSLGEIDYSVSVKFDKNVDAYTLTLSREKNDKSKGVTSTLESSTVLSRTPVMFYGAKEEINVICNVPNINSLIERFTP
ncbi:MAG: hypothetical protein HON90_17115 [Halobacteriovoraceae bacterium]|jgi:hypothetical protein|nr:hypothetical protein [Halobacteriovoraceae bacterium]